MRRYNAMVKIGGALGHQVPKRGITATEIVILLTINGSDSVHQIQALPGDQNMRHEDLRREMEKRYRHTHVGSDDNRRPALHAAFPSWPNGQLPTTVRDAGVPEELVLNKGRPVGDEGDEEKAKAEAEAEEKAKAEAEAEEKAKAEAEAEEKAKAEAEAEEKAKAEAEAKAQAEAEEKAKAEAEAKAQAEAEEKAKAEAEAKAASKKKASTKKTAASKTNGGFME